MTKSLLIQWGQMHSKFGDLPDHLIESHRSGCWAPNTDVCVGSCDVVIKMELAGLPRENIAITVEKQSVIVEGSRRDPYGGESNAGYRFQQLEIQYGPFRREIPVPVPVDTEKSTAEHTDGILKIILPKARKAKNTKISVTMD